MINIDSEGNRTWSISWDLEDDIFRRAEAHDGGAHVVSVALVVVVRVSRRQVQSDVISVVYLEFGRKVFISMKSTMWWVQWSIRRQLGRTYPPDSFQSSRVDLVHVVDLGGGVVVLSVTNDVDQVVVGEIGDDVAKVTESPEEKKMF